MENKTMWLIVGAVAIVGFFIWRSRGGTTVQSIGGTSRDTTEQQANYIQGLSALASVATAKAQSDAQLAAINASVETSRINAGAQVAIANRQGAVQQSNDLFSNAGKVIIAALPFIF